MPVTSSAPAFPTPHPTVAGTETSGGEHHGARGSRTLAFAGDVHFEGRAKRLLHAPSAMVTALDATLGQADFALVNLETAIGRGGRPMPGKVFTFEAPPSALRVVSAAGVDAVSMANNHAADFGNDVFAQTLEAKRSSPIPVVGIGRDAREAFTPLELDLDGLRVAVLASSQVRDLTGLHHAAGPRSPGIAANLDPSLLRQAVRSAAASHDLVVVVMHWGTEQAPCADERQQATARQLAADGADVVVGGHAHRPQGAGWLGTTFVGYGLGNFVWYHSAGTSGQSGVLSLTVDAAYATSTTRAMPRAGLTGRKRPVVTAATWTPMLIGADGVPREASGGRAAALSRAWAASTRCSGLSPSPGVH